MAISRPNPRLPPDTTATLSDNANSLNILGRAKTEESVAACIAAFTPIGANGDTDCTG